MKTKPIITALALGASTCILTAQDDNPPRDRQGPPPREDRPNEHGAARQRPPGILTNSQKEQLKAILSKYNANTFLPPGKVADFCGFQYMRDVDTNQLGHNTSFVPRAANNMLHMLTEKQKESLGKMAFNNSATWPELKDQVDKKSLSQTAHVAVMTYASELFSWYAGNVEADVYFCPERHATYFGSFYMKDIPAMGNANYSISTSLTRPTELQYWDASRADNGYNFFGVGGMSYLLDMEGRVIHTWPIGTNPHLLSNGSVLDADTDDPSGNDGYMCITCPPTARPSPAYLTDPKSK